MASDVPCELRAAVQAGMAVRARGPKAVGVTLSANLPTQGLVPFSAARPPSPVLTLPPGHSPEHYRVGTPLAEQRGATGMLRGARPASVWAGVWQPDPLRAVGRVRGPGHGCASQQQAPVRSESRDSTSQPTGSPHTATNPW